MLFVKHHSSIQYTWAAVLLAITLGLAGCSKQTPAEPVYSIGIVSGFDAFAEISRGFKEQMTTLGYIEGQNVVYDVQSVDPSVARDKQVIENFIAQDVDLLFTFPTEASLWAKSLTRETDIPIVFAMAGVEGNDLIDRMHQPGEHITGVRYQGPDLIVKRFELLRELVPTLQTVWTVYDPNYPTNAAAIQMLRQAVAAADVTLEEALVTSLDEIRADLEARAASGAPRMDGIVIMPDPISQTPAGWDLIVQFATEHMIPISGGGSGTQAVLNYSPDLFEMGRQAASLADKILQGTPAGSIMVVTPPSHLQLNYKLAQELGLTVPEGLLSRADEIIR